MVFCTNQEMLLEKYQPKWFCFLSSLLEIEQKCKILDYVPKKKTKTKQKQNKQKKIYLHRQTNCSAETKSKIQLLNMHDWNQIQNLCVCVAHPHSGSVVLPV